MFFVVGLGSMGRRRVRCLLANGVPPEEILGFDRRPDRCAEAKERHGISVADQAEQMGRAEVEAVFVSVWPSFHVEYCLMAAMAGKHWFCEVPLELSSSGLDQLRRVTRDRKLVGAVGSQMIWHPASEHMAQWLSEDATGGLAGAWGTCTSYFPTWHPWEDYREFYVSDKASGGANIDMIGHEFQWLVWLLDSPVAAVNARASRRSDQELKPGSYDSYEIIAEFASGLQISMHFDGVNRGLERGVWLAGNAGTVHWDLRGPKASRFDRERNAWVAEGPEQFEYEQAYVREVGHFIECIRGRAEWPIAFERAINVVKLIAAVEQSVSRFGGRVFVE